MAEREQATRAAPETVVIRKYANRRLYNTATSSYVTLDTLCEMVRNGEEFVVRAATKGGSGVSMQVFRPEGESPTASTIRNIIQELETGERTSGNIDVTMQSVEVQFGIAHSHLQGGARVSLPVADRSLYIPGG